MSKALVIGGVVVGLAVIGAGGFLLLRYLKRSAIGGASGAVISAMGLPVQSTDSGPAGAADWQARGEYANYLRRWGMGYTVPNGWSVSNECAKCWHTYQGQTDPWRTASYVEKVVGGPCLDAQGGHTESAECFSAIYNMAVAKRKACGCNTPIMPYSAVVGTAWGR